MGRGVSDYVSLPANKNQLGDGPGISGLMAAIHKQGQITELDLSENRISKAGAQALADALQNNRSLTVLNLSHCHIDAEATEILAPAIAKHPALKTVNLNDNAIGDAGIVHLAAALVGHPTLASLHISNNTITDIGAFALLDLWQQNGVLQDSQRPVPLHQLELSNDGRINVALYNALQRASRFFGFLPYQELQLRKYVQHNQESILALERSLDFLYAIRALLQRPPVSEEAYKKRLQEVEAGLRKDAEIYIKGRSDTVDIRIREQVREKITEETHAKITALHILYTTPDLIQQWLQAPQPTCEELSKEIAELEKTREQYQAQNQNYLGEDIPAIVRERDEFRTWFLLLTPGISKLPKEQQLATTQTSLTTILSKTTAPTDHKVLVTTPTTQPKSVLQGNKYETPVQERKHLMLDNPSTPSSSHASFSSQPTTLSDSPFLDDVNTPPKTTLPLVPPPHQAPKILISDPPSPFPTNTSVLPSFSPLPLSIRPPSPTIAPSSQFFTALTSTPADKPPSPPTTEKSTLYHSCKTLIDQLYPSDDFAGIRQKYVDQLKQQQDNPQALQSLLEKLQSEVKPTTTNFTTVT
jgi:hypothetical protein